MGINGTSVDMEMSREGPMINQCMATSGEQGYEEKC